jgi:hypothetical protein
MAMKIAFYCPHCATRLVVDGALVGRVGRCRSCGRRLIVPEGQPVAAGARVVRKQPGPAGCPEPTQTRPTANKATGRGPADIAPRPATPQDDLQLQLADDLQLRAVPRAPAAAPTPELEAWETDTSELSVNLPPVTAAARPRGNEPSAAFKAYRTFFNSLVQATTWISETSYAISLVILMLAVAGGMIGHHVLAALGLKAIIGLNLVGLAGDLASLVNLSFRKDPLRGAMFLIPPVGLYYIWTDWRRYRDTVGRMRIPLMTLAFVGAAYLFVPWLSGGSDSEGSVVASVERTLGTIEEKLGGRQGVIGEQLETARSWLREAPAADAPSPASGPTGSGRSAPGS